MKLASKPLSARIFLIMSYYPRESDPNLNYTEYPEETSSRSTHNSEVYPSNAGYTTINAGRSDDYGTSHYQSTVGNNSGYTDYGTSSYGDTSSVCMRSPCDIGRILTMPKTAFRNQTTSIAQGCTCQKNCASGIGCRCDEPYEASSDYGYGYDDKVINT